jgi:DNA-binding NarL/FixJ family response regulator
MTNTTKRRVLIVDDHPVVREGIVHLINQQPDLVVCAEAEDGDTVLQKVREQCPDILIIDITLKTGDGLELTRQLRDQGIEVPILILSMHDESLYADRALRAGANGYIMKEEARTDIIEAIHRVAERGIYVSDSVRDDLLGAGRRRRGDGFRDRLGSLTDRELEVFRLIGMGQATQDIAKQMRISRKTVESHRVHIKEKLGVTHLNELLRLAVHWVEHDQ